VSATRELPDREAARALGLIENQDTSTPEPAIYAADELFREACAQPWSGSTGFAADSVRLAGSEMKSARRTHGHAEIGASGERDRTTFLGMRAEVKYFEWDDIDSAITPLSEQITGLVFAAGPLGSVGADNFHVTVCTPEALATMVARDGDVIGRHFVFVASINPRRVEETIRDRLRRLDGDSWTDLAEKIGRIGHWEFADYTDTPR
jgi:hypothetical protein